MREEIIALAGDLVFERKRLSEAFRRLEGSLLYGELAQEISRRLGVSGTEMLHAQMDLIAKGLDRIGALAKTLIYSVSNEKQVSCMPLMESGARVIEETAVRLKRPVIVDCKASDVKINSESAQAFEPLFREMLETFFEYCIEPAKERAARKKRAKAYFQFEVRALEDGYRIMVMCDGNGILPPLSSEHGVKLARVGGRAAFEGKPGAWSAWFFYLPPTLGTVRCVTVRAGGRRLCVPAWAIVAPARPIVIQKDEKKRNRLHKVWALGESISRFEVEENYASSYGKNILSIGAGTQTVEYVFEEVSDPEEVFMKPLHPMFTGNGRFTGVVMSEPSEGASAEGSVEAPSELCLVMNPAYLVYGPDALEVTEGIGDWRTVVGGPNAG